MSISATFFHQPPVVFEILSGIILGPSVFGHYKKYHDTVFPADTIDILELIADIGLVFYIFTVGVHLRTDTLSKNMKGVWLIAILGIVLPFFSAFLIIPIINQIFQDSSPDHQESEPFDWISVSFLGTSLSVTALPILACVLTDKGLIESDVGVLTLGAGYLFPLSPKLNSFLAAVEEIFLWFIITIILSFVNAKSFLNSFVVIGSILSLCLVLFLVIRPIFTWIVISVERSSQAWKWKNTLFALTLVLLMICAWCTEFIGVHPILGSFLCGVAIPVSPCAFSLPSLPPTLSFIISLEKFRSLERMWQILFSYR
jgi:Kef-type K+ transport system membrane component KefB